MCIQIADHCFESLIKKRVVWIIGHETKSSEIIWPVSGKKLVSGGRWPSGTDGQGAGGLRGIGWLVAGAVLGNCILIGS